MVALKNISSLAYTKMFNEKYNYSNNCLHVAYIF